MRVDELRSGIDRTLEVTTDELFQSENLKFTNSAEDLRDCNIHIITVPTPIDENKQPDLSPLEKSTTTVGNLLKHGDIVIYESTVYPEYREVVFQS